jgi:5-methyltetrahydrofolate--homocysteine methyltransferase
MNRFEELLRTEPVILLDGAMGTMLMAAGLTSGASPEEWNATHPERVRAVHREYIQAGSRLVLTNTFGGNRYRMALHDLQERVFELNQAAAQNARLEADAAGWLVAVGGSMGPTGELLEPMGTLTPEGAQEAFAEQAAGLAAGGADVIWIETMSDLNEVKAAIAGAQAGASLPIVATMTFDTRGFTMMGVSPQKAVEELAGLSLIAIGANCGTGPAELEIAIGKMRQANPQMVLVAKSNAGVPQWQNNQLLYDGTPQVMAGYADQARQLGARLIGACCGSTPEHIRAMADALGLTPAASA